jgi:hypothetical protein
MHGYSTESNERRVVPFLLAVLAVGLAWSTARALAILHLHFPWWADAPSSLGYYGVLYGLFDKYLWRNSLARRLGLSKIPDLSGAWHGYLTTSFDSHSRRYHVLVQIFQSWTQISIFLTTITSISASRIAAIEASGPEGVALIYEYQNQPLSNAARTMHMHYGTATLRISGSSFTGEYYAGRDRRTFGRICCWKAKRVNYRARAA